MTTDHSPMIAEGQVWLLDRGDQSVGLIVLIDQPDHLLIQNIAVHPDAQKQGFGRRLLDWAEVQARQKNYLLLRLYTNLLMTENQALYKHVGYVEIGREPYMGFTLVYMEKKLEDGV